MIIADGISLPNGASTSIQINPSGNFTNNGTITALDKGIIFISPFGNIILGSNSIIQSSGTGQVLLSKNVINAGSLSVSDITNISVNQTATYSQSSGGISNIASTATMNVGNSAQSEVNNAGTFTLVSGGVVNVGLNDASRGIFTNTSGTTTINGTLNGRTTISGGVLTGSGTINSGVVSGTSLTALVMTSNGRLAPGNSPGQITIGGGLVFEGGTVDLDIHSGSGSNNSNGSTGASGTPGLGFDTINVQPPTGTTAASNAEFNVRATSFKLRTANNSTTLPFASDTFWNNGTVGFKQRWRILTTTNGQVKLLDSNGTLLNPGGLILEGIIPANVELFASNDLDLSSPINYLQTYNNGNFTYEVLGSSTAQSLNLVWNPVPEPVTIIGLSLIVFSGYGFLKKRNKALVPHRES